MSTMSVTHSPTPWTADHTWNGVILIKDASGAVIATLEKHAAGVPGSGVPATSHAERQTANAGLIVAAPTMLDALKTTAGNIRSLGPAGALSAVPVEYREWLRVIDSAIADAERR